MIELTTRKFLAEIKELQEKEPNSLITTTIFGSQSANNSYMDETQTENIFHHFRLILMYEAEFLDNERIAKEFVSKFPYQQTLAAIEAEDFKVMNFWVTRFAEELRMNYIANGRYLLDERMEEMLEDEGHRFIEAEMLGRDPNSDIRLRFQNQDDDIIDQYYAWEIEQYRLDREEVFMTGEEVRATREEEPGQPTVNLSATVDREVGVDLEERERIEVVMDEAELGPIMVAETPDTRAMQVDTVESPSEVEETTDTQTIVELNRKAKQDEELRQQQLSYLARQRQEQQEAASRARARQPKPVTNFIKVATGVCFASAIGVGSTIPLLNVIGAI